MQTLKNLSESAINKFVAENAGEVMDFAEGSLLDNVVYTFTFGTLFCFEQYLNEWSSGYICYFFHNSRRKGINKMWDCFNALKTENA